MAIQMASYTKAMIEKAEKLAELVPTLARHRDKQTGIEYVVVPSSDDPEHTGHATNGLTCTCDGHRKRGFCTHALAVSTWDSRQQMARIEAAQQFRQQNGKCKQQGCLFTAIRVGGRCADHNRVLCDELGY